MASVRIVVPDATINYVKNPSMRYGTDGWNATAGGTISRSLLAARFGIASLRVITNGTALYEGAYYRINWLQGITDDLSGSIYILGTGIVRVRLIEAGNKWVSDPIRLSPLRWQRVAVPGRCNGSNDVRLYVETDQKAQATTFYLDAAQAERKSEATTYCDGDQPGCRWNGVSHSSLSSRSAYTREGGRWITLAGSKRVEENLYVTEIAGLGVPPITNSLQSYAMAPGSSHQGTKINNRVITMTFHAKKVKFPRNCDDPSLAAIHQLRHMLYDVFKPDRTRGGQEIITEYQDGDYPLYFGTRYDGGMDGDWDIRNEFVHSFPLRVLAISPLMREDTQKVDALNFVNDLGILNNAAGRIDGTWDRLNYGFNDRVRGFRIGPDGKMYAYGDFTRVNYNAAAVDAMIWAGGIAYWDGTQWQKIGNGAISAGGYVADVAIAPNGYIYVTGSFTSIGGVAAANVAYWDGANWNAMGAGLGSYGLAIRVAPNGRIYVGGNFSTAGGAPAYRIASWFAGTWAFVGAYGGLNNIVEDLEITPDGTHIYVGGQFTDEQTNPGSSLNYICVLDVSANTFSGLSTGMDGIVYSLALAEDGRLYVTGAFTTAGDLTVNYVTVWDGSSWKALGTGLNASGLVVSVAPDQTVLCGGNFTTAGGITVSYAAIWNGSVWQPLDIVIAPGATPAVYALVENIAGDLFVGGSAFATGSKASRTTATTLVTNIGSAEVYPTMYILGPGSLRRIENITTRKVVLFALDILANEEVFLDFGRGTIRSTVRGDLSETILRSSEFRDFSLLPGENKIGALMLNDVSSYMQISHTPTHWSVDSTQPGNEF